MAIGQIVVMVVFVAAWIATRFDDTTGVSLNEIATVVGTLGSLPAFLTGVVAGLVAARKPKLRRGLLIGFALSIALAAVALYVATPHVCSDASSCSESWKDAFGAFLGAEFAIAFQGVVAWLFAGIARKYPLRMPEA